MCVDVMVRNERIREHRTLKRASERERESMRVCMCVGVCVCVCVCVRERVRERERKREREREKGGKRVTDRGTAAFCRNVSLISASSSSSSCRSSASSSSTADADRIAVSAAVPLSGLCHSHQLEITACADRPGSFCCAGGWMIVW